MKPTIKDDILALKDKIKAVHDQNETGHYSMVSDDIIVVYQKGIGTGLQPSVVLDILKAARFMGKD